MSELLPCPCCGSAAEFDEATGDDFGGHFIACTNRLCGLTTPLMFACGEDPKPLLAERWNRRAPAGVPREPTMRIRDMGERPPDLTLERINNDGPYEKSNCRWASRAEQNRNKWNKPYKRRDRLATDQL